MGNTLWGGPSCPADLKEKALAGFSAAFGGEEQRPTAMGVAPGRIEVLGNHTDYNEGFILAAAIDRYVVVAGRLAPEDSKKCRLASEFFKGGVVEFTVEEDGDWEKAKQDGDSAWANYVIGTANELAKAGAKVGCFEAFVISNVPPGAGVSSSAALEMATAKLLGALFPDTVGTLDQLAMVKAAKAAENNFVGMGCGILDQFSSGMGQAGNLIALDCRTLEYYLVPFSGARFVLANTHAPHQLVDGKYDELRASCFKAKDLLKFSIGDDSITHLRDVDSKILEEHKACLGEEELKRAEHIVLENERVHKGAEAATAGDATVLGQCMSQSHESSRDKFGNSCKELDIMQRLSQSIPGLYGSRLMGGGFGGSTLNLVAEDQVDNFVEELSRQYEAETKIKPTILVCSTGDGAFAEAV